VTVGAPHVEYFTPGFPDLWFFLSPYRGLVEHALRRSYERHERTWPKAPRSRALTLLLASLGGIFGAHNFYLGRWRRGVVSVLFFWTLVLSS
jgi:hypothetical protein